MQARAVQSFPSTADIMAEYLRYFDHVSFRFLALLFIFSCTPRLAGIVLHYCIPALIR
jgi:hypothetical protein